MWYTVLKGDQEIVCSGSLATINTIMKFGSIDGLVSHKNVPAKHGQQSKAPQSKESKNKAPQSKESKSKAPQSKGPQSKGQAKRIRVYTDGSKPDPCGPGAASGFGVFFGEHDPRNISEPLYIEKPTNNKAEFMAIVAAILAVDTNQPLEICTDSQYCQNCVGKWFDGWSGNGWKTSSGKPVKNKDLVIRLRTLMDQRGNITIRHVKAHTSGKDADSVGNRRADALAVSGAKKYCSVGV